ncbi:hypothetical protein BJ138DRAFT_1147826 [Hygrophoropsis aurantiaca]|uniref:Uncharacterized protein n=1 Tax=Hygrophoropsis aurantiaca TaxID=72124 RepID=A0ACB8AGJ9_9AGAM|nr:hypothetical protein BJ138DRAFT_1147826 [Hygrophoropsis aurantiaca]
MSLPPATKDISEHPASGSVVAPTDKKLKEEDVDRKIRFYGVIEAFRQGRMPDNKQIDETLRYLEKTSPVNLDELSPDGRKLIQDSRDIIETARVMVREKNADELFQNFVWHTRDVNLSGAKKDPNEVVSVDRSKVDDDSRQAVRHLRTILTIVMTNSEVRKLLSDFSIIGRDLLAKGASVAVENLRPGEEELARVNEAAPENEFITKGGRKAGPGETPVLEARVPGTDTQIEQHPHDDDAKVTTGDGQVKSGSQAIDEGRGTAQDMQNRARDVTGDIKGQASQATDSAKQQAGKAKDQGNLDGVAADYSSDDTEAKKQGFKERMLAFRDGFSERIPEGHKQKIGEHYDRGRHYLMDEYFPEERRDQFIFRAKKVIIECQKHDDYQEAMRWLLTSIEEYAGHGQHIATHAKESHQTATSDPALKTATSELRALLERFANGQSMDIIFDAVNVLIDDGRRDAELRGWFKQFDSFIRKVLLQAGFVLEDQCNTEGSELRESGRKFWDDKYKSHFDNLFASTGNWFSAMGEDSLNKRFGEDWARLTRDLLFDSEGSLKFKPDLWSDIRKVILPTLVNQVGYVPIPRIEYTDEVLDLVVENLTLQGRNLFPNIMSMEAHNFMKFSPYNAISDVHHHEFTLTFAQMQADMRDVAFYFHKKTGFPKISDSGLADVLLGGSGLTAIVHLVSADKDKTSVFKVKNVNVKVDSLKFSIRDSKHDLLYKTLRPLATGLVKKQIQKAVADAIRTGLEYVDGQLVSVRDRMDEAKASEDKNRKQVLEELFQRKKEEGVESVKTSDSKSQFKIVANKRESMIDTGHPSGWVNLVTEREEKASTGKDWHSEAFSIVNPQPTKSHV